MEVIVVDQNNDSLIDDIVLNYKVFLKIKHLKLKFLPILARNYGVKEATYDIVCFPDDDCWFDENTLIKVDNHFLKIPLIC